MFFSKFLGDANFSLALFVCLTIINITKIKNRTETSWLGLSLSYNIMSELEHENW